MEELRDAFEQLEINGEHVIKEYGTRMRKGKHAQEDAFLYVRNESKIPENPSVDDVVSVLMTCMEWQ